MHEQLHLSVSCPLQGASRLTQGWVDTVLMGPPPVSASRTRLIHIWLLLFTFLFTLPAFLLCIICTSNFTNNIKLMLYKVETIQKYT